MIPVVVFIFLSIQLLVVAYTDLKTKKISNIWLLVNFLFFCLLTIIFPAIYYWNVSSFIYSFVFLLVGFVLFWMNIMGGGDSKYLSSFYLLVPAAFQDTVFIYLLYTTIIVGSSLLLFNALQNFDRLVVLFKMNDLSGIKKIFGSRFTYAPVIFIAWMWFGWINFSHIKF
jgi:prepilin peptidase CpaA